MFERFTDSARRAVVLAQEQARAEEHHRIGVGHLLLALLDVPEGAASVALARSGVRADDVRQKVRDLEAARGSRPRDHAPDHLPFAPELKALLERAPREAGRAGQATIDTEHLLLALTGAPGERPARELAALGVDADQVRTEVLRLRPPATGPAGDDSPETRLGAPAAEQLNRVENLLRDVQHRLDEVLRRLDGRA